MAVDSDHGPQPGVYNSDTGVVGCCVAKHMKQEKFGFMVCCYSADSTDKGDVKIWCADLIRQAIPFTSPEDQKEYPSWKLKGHPDDNMFVSIGKDLVQYTKDFGEKLKTWSFQGTVDDNHQTFMREPAGKPILKFPTENYHEAVHMKNPALNEPFSPDTATILKACCHVQSEDIPTDPIKRQGYLAKMYTLESPLYHEMNTALREDDLLKLKYFGAYIKELRDVFKTDHENQVIEPFSGTLWRGIHFGDPDKELEHFKPGSKFSWPAFTSMTTDKSVALRFGNITFEVRCCPPRGTYDDDKAEYAPASVSKWSSFPSESEILFPPNTEFIVKKIVPPGPENSNPIIKCETIGFDTDEGQAEFDPSVDESAGTGSHMYNRGGGGWRGEENSADAST